MKLANIGLVVAYRDSEPVLVEVLSDDQEMEILAAALVKGAHANPLRAVYEHRVGLQEQDEKFGNFVEGLVSQPFIKPDVRTQGVEWFKSKIRYEHYQKSEGDAASVIARYAFTVYQQDHDKTDFFLESSKARVRVRVFECPSATLHPLGHSMNHRVA